MRFYANDHVRIADDLGPTMAHFTSGCEAIVIGSYADKYGGDDHDSYTLHIKGQDQSSWYECDQLTLIEHNRGDLLEQWAREEDEEARLKGSHDWIFANGEEILNHAHGATVATLAADLGIDSLWGERGEGFVYYQNMILVLHIATLFLLKGDKDGWLKFCRDNPDLIKEIRTKPDKHEAKQ